ncbi:unnamed protein product, partial [Adineta ricciae]
ETGLQMLLDSYLSILGSVYIHISLIQTQTRGHAKSQTVTSSQQISTQNSVFPAEIYSSTPTVLSYKSDVYYPCENFTGSVDLNDIL